MAREYIFDILGDSPDNIKMIEDTLIEIKSNLFSNVYNAQRAATEIRKFNLTMNNYMKMTSTSVSYSIPIPLITESYRDKFRQSIYYRQRFPVSTILEHPDIFYLSVLVFINGYLYTNYWVKPEESNTIISFNIYPDFYEPAPYVNPGLTQDEINGLIENETNMTVIFIPEYQQGIYRTNINNMNLRTLGATNTGINIVEFSNYSDTLVDEDTRFLCFMTQDDSSLYKYTTMTTSNNETSIFFTPSEIRALTNRYTYIQNMKFRNMLPLVDISKDDDFFKIPLQSMPIPVENLLVFRRTASGVKYDHETTLTLFYPNYYKINKTHNDDIVIIPFYKDDTTYGIRHQDELSLYHRFTTDILEKYNDDTIPSLIKDYNGISTTYGIEGYKNQESDHFHYKVDTLIELIRQNGEFYKPYLNRLIDYVPTFFIDVSDIANLQSRYRTDTSNESPENIITFSYPCYVFIFRRDNNNEHYLITIDNRIFVPEYMISSDTALYIYIPVTMINTDTIIYSQKFFDAYHAKNIIPENITDYYNIDIPVGVGYVANNIFVTNATHNYIDKADYELYTRVGDIYKQVIYDDFYPYDNLYVKIVNAELLNVELQIVATRMNSIRYQYMNRNFNIHELNNYIDMDDNNFRLFKNGLLLPSSAFKIKYALNAGGPHIVRSLTSIEEDTEFAMTYTNEKRYLIYENPLIDEYGIVNLYGEINKPISLKWFDIYLNGLRLNSSNIEILSPYLMLIKNVPTRLNLQIYQIGLDGEYAGTNIDQEADDIGNQIYEDIDGLLDNIRDTITPLPNDMPDIYNDIFDDVLGILEDFAALYNFINPDLQQITEQMVIDNSELLDENSNYFINPDIRQSLPYNPYFNPDRSSITAIASNDD